MHKTSVFTYDIFNGPNTRWKKKRNIGKEIDNSDWKVWCLIPFGLKHLGKGFELDSYFNSHVISLEDKLHTLFYHCFKRYPFKLYDSDIYLKAFFVFLKASRNYNEYCFKLTNIVFVTVSFYFSYEEEKRVLKNFKKVLAVEQ